MPVRGFTVSSHCHLSFIISCMTGCVVSGWACAQTDDLFALSLEDLMQVEVHSASLQASNLSGAPSTVSLVSPNDWEKRGARRWFEALAHLPATIPLQQSTGSVGLGSRGYSTQASTAYALYWDGMPINDYYLSSRQFVFPDLNLDTVHRIEYVRGPGSALYGSDAFSSIVSIESYEADTDELRARGALGSDGYYQGSLRSSAAWGEHARVNVAVAGNGQPDQSSRYAYQGDNGFELSGERAMAYDTTTLVMKVQVDDHQGTAWETGVYVVDVDMDEFAGLGSAPSQRNDQSSHEARFYGVQTHLNQTLSDVNEVVLKAYYWQTDVLIDNGLIVNDAPLSRRSEQPQHRLGVGATYTHSIPSVNTTLAMGVELDELGVDDATFWIRDSNHQTLADGELPVADRTRRIRSLIAEGNTLWQDDRWKLTYGGRFDDYSDVDSHFSPRAALIHQLTENQTIKLMAGHAYRAPGAVELLGSPGILAENTELRPETIDTYELVWLHHWYQGMLQVELFRNHWEDAMVATENPSPPPALRVDNAQSNAAHGVAMEWRQRWEAWQLEWSASYVESENRVTGQRYAQFPRVIANLGVGYSFEASNLDVFLNQRYYSATDDLRFPELGQEPSGLGSYLRTDVTLRKRFDAQWHLDLSARNVFDRDNVLPSPNGSLGGIPDDAFSVVLGVTYTQ